MPEETAIFARKASGLVRELAWYDVLLIVIAGPAASGMVYYSVKIPGLEPGGNMVLAFLVGGILWLLPVILVAVFASSFPRSGALYVAVSRIVHPLLAFLPNWLWIISCGFTTGFMTYLGLNVIASGLQLGGQIGGSSSMSSAGDWFAGEITRLWLSALLVLVVWGFQRMGLSQLKWFVRAVIYLPAAATAVAIVLLLAFNGATAWNEVYGAGVVEKIHQAAIEQGVQDATKSGGAALYGMLLWVFWAYSGVEAISFVGSEVKSPRTSFMRGLTIGFAAIVALYCFLAWAPGFTFGSDFIRDYSYLYNTSDESYAALEAAMSSTPVIPSLPFYAGVCGGSVWLAVLLGAGFFLWYYNTAMIMYTAAVRGLFAMSFDRQLPLSWCAVSKSGAPTTATHILGAVGLLGCVLGYADAHSPDTAYVAIAILDWTALFFIWPIGLAAVFLPYTRPDLYEKTTFQQTWFGIPAVSILGVIVMAIGWWTAFMVGLELSELYSQIGLAVIISVGFALVGMMYSRNRKEGIDPNKIFTEIPPS